MPVPMPMSEPAPDDNAPAESRLPLSAGALSDSEWREFRQIPDQGYSHRHWIETRIREHVDLALAEVEEQITAWGDMAQRSADRAADNPARAKQNLLRALAYRRAATVVLNYRRAVAAGRRVGAHQQRAERLNGRVRELDALYEEAAEDVSHYRDKAEQAEPAVAAVAALRRLATMPDRDGDWGLFHEGVRYLPVPDILRVLNAASTGPDVEAPSAQSADSAEPAAEGE